MSRSRVILLTVAAFAVAAFLIVRSGGQEAWLGPPGRDESGAADSPLPAEPTEPDPGAPWRGGERREVGRGTVKVLSGATTELTVDTVPTRIDRAEVTGTLTFPEAWPLYPAQICFRDRWGETRGVASVKSLANGPEAAIFAILKALLSPGEYFVVVGGFRCRTTVTIPPTGARLDLRMPGPAEVLLQIIDAESGEDVPDAEIAWQTVTRELPGQFQVEAEFDEGTGLYRFMSPPGRAGIHVRAEGYTENDVFVEVMAGNRIFTKTWLERAAVLTVTFLIDGEPFPAEDIKVHVEIKTKHGEPWGGGQTRRGEGNAVIFDDLESGTVELTVDPPTGFKAVKPEIVEVRQGESRELVFDFERK